MKRKNKTDRYVWPPRWMLLGCAKLLVDILDKTDRSPREEADLLRTYGIHKGESHISLKSLLDSTNHVGKVAKRIAKYKAPPSIIEALRVASELF